MEILRKPLFCALCAFSVLTAGALDRAALKAACVNKVEQLAQKMLPQEKFNRALGFFGPVTKKYMPVFQRFNEEYLAGTNKMAVVRKYLPNARLALDEAKAMKIPAKYEKEKADYIQMGEAFLTVLNLTARFG